MRKINLSFYYHLNIIGSTGSYIVSVNTTRYLFTIIMSNQAVIVIDVVCIQEICGYLDI